MHSTTVIPVYWGSRWSNSSFVGDKVTGLDTLYAGIGGTSYVHTNGEYTDGSGNVNTSSISKAGELHRHVGDALGRSGHERGARRGGEGDGQPSRRERVLPRLLRPAARQRRLLRVAQLGDVQRRPRAVRVLLQPRRRPELRSAARRAASATARASRRSRTSAATSSARRSPIRSSTPGTTRGATRTPTSARGRSAARSRSAARAGRSRATGATRPRTRTGLRERRLHRDELTPSSWGEPVPPTGPLARLTRVPRRSGSAEASSAPPQGQEQTKPGSGLLRDMVRTLAPWGFRARVAVVCSLSPCSSSRPRSRSRSSRSGSRSAALRGTRTWSGTSCWRWVPFVLALLAYDRHRRGSRGLALWLPLALWLVFLPNAPYLVTDFMLLRDIRDMPVWFDVALLTSFAWTGLLLGFASVYLVQDLARRAAGPRRRLGLRRRRVRRLRDRDLPRPRPALEQLGPARPAVGGARRRRDAPRVTAARRHEPPDVRVPDRRLRDALRVRPRRRGAAGDLDAGGRRRARQAREQLGRASRAPRAEALLEQRADRGDVRARGRPRASRALLGQHRIGHPRVARADALARRAPARSRPSSRRVTPEGVSSSPSARSTRRRRPSSARESRSSAS